MSDEVMLGHMIRREITQITDQGAFIDGGEFGELFVPRSQLPKDIGVGQELRVFLFKDGGRVLATARHPYLELGMTGRLRVTDIDCGTVYMDLGIPKELVVPISEQRSMFEVGQSVMVYVAMDDQGRLFGTQRYNRYIRDVPEKRDSYKRFQRVTLVPISRTPLGYKAIVNDEVYGLMYKENEKGEIHIGKRYDGFVLSVRPDGRLDVSLQQPGVGGTEHAASELMKILESSGGFLGFNDKSPAEDIEDFLHMSKGRFKKAIGNLYKQRYIELLESGIKLTEAGQKALDEKNAKKAHKE